MIVFIYVVKAQVWRRAGEATFGVVSGRWRTVQRRLGLDAAEGLAGGTDRLRFGQGRLAPGGGRGAACLAPPKARDTPGLVVLGEDGLLATQRRIRRVRQRCEDCGRADGSAKQAVHGRLIQDMCVCLREARERVHLEALAGMCEVPA